MPEKRYAVFDFLAFLLHFFAFYLSIFIYSSKNVYFYGYIMNIYALNIHFAACKKWNFANLWFYITSLNGICQPFFHIYLNFFMFLPHYLRFWVANCGISQTNTSYLIFVYIFHFYAFFVFLLQTYVWIVFILQTRLNRQSSTHAHATILLYYTHARKKVCFTPIKI